MAIYLQIILFSLVLNSIVQVECKKKPLIHLNEDNWGDMLEGEWMVEFFAPWCPACKALQPVWEDFSGWSDDLGIHVGQVDVTGNAGLSGRFMVTALPTIFHVKDGQFRQYQGSRDKEEFISFIEEKKWSALDEVSSWKSPSSVQMSVVSYFFRLSMILRSIHTKLVEEYKFPYWASLVLFAVATIMIGAILGLLLVCVVDFLFPPKYPGSPPPKPTTPKKGKAAVLDAETKCEKKDESNEVNKSSNSSSPSRSKEGARKKKHEKKEQ